MRLRGPLLLLVALGLTTPAPRSEAAARREIPRPLPGHPGNVFLVGEEVAVPVPTEGAWQLLDYAGTVVREVAVARREAELGKLGPGWYELAQVASSNRVWLGVIEPLRAPTPRTSPIGADVAAAWLVPERDIPAVARLCAMAGLNHVRDRMHWRELETARGTFARSNRYDFSAAAQHAEGLAVLQVSHSSPAWANPNTKRFPPDLRDTYAFHRHLAARWRGQVTAFEPWNEADIDVFGGHTGSEMASLQKAAYWGLKAGNPDVIVCLNVPAHHRATTLGNLHQNAAWPYFDTYNLHHYEAFDKYPGLYADHRAVSAGRPLWVSECSVPVKWQGESAAQEPSAADLRVQSERVTRVFAQSIHEGAQAVFYFVLPHYVEGQTQFGLLRRDLTPRPGFIALAAAGRLMADAKPLGKVKSADFEGYLFDARTDGRATWVLVAWAPGETKITLPKTPVAVYDHLGRRLESGVAIQLGPAPRFILLARGTKLEVERPPQSPPALPGKPSPVVLQVLAPESAVHIEESAFKVTPGETTLPLYLYHFGQKPVRGRLSAKISAPWQAALTEQTISLEPGDRKELPLRITAPAGPPPAKATLRIEGRFEGAGEPLVSVNLMDETPRR